MRFVEDGEGQSLALTGAGGCRDGVEFARSPGQVQPGAALIDADGLGNLATAGGEQLVDGAVGVLGLILGDCRDLDEGRRSLAGPPLDADGFALRVPAVEADGAGEFRDGDGADQRGLPPALRALDDAAPIDESPVVIEAVPRQDEPSLFIGEDERLGVVGG